MEELQLRYSYRKYLWITNQDTCFFCQSYLCFASSHWFFCLVGKEKKDCAFINYKSALKKDGAPKSGCCRQTKNDC